MTLIEQLRDILNQPQGPTYKSLHELCGEAADEIERLRHENRMFAIAIVEGDEAFEGGEWELLTQRAEAIVNEQNAVCKHGFPVGGTPCLYCEHEAGRGPIPKGERLWEDH